MLSTTTGDQFLVAFLQAINSRDRAKFGDAISLLSPDSIAHQRLIHYCRAVFLDAMGNESEALQSARMAAEAGMAEASLLVGRHYQLGRGGESDLELARYWFQRAGEQGLAAGYFALGLTHKNSDGSWSAPREAELALRKAVDLGHPLARSWLAPLLLRSPVDKDVQEGWQMLLKAGNEGDFLALTKLSSIYRYGLQGQMKDDVVADRYAALADQAMYEWHEKLEDEI